MAATVALKVWSGLTVAGSEIAKRVASAARAGGAATTRVVTAMAAPASAAKRRDMAAILRLFPTDHPHCEELGAAAVGVAKRRPGTVDLVLACRPTYLHGRFGKSDHPGRTDRIGRQDATRRVDRHVPVHRRRAGVRHLPAFTFGGEAEVLHPHGLEPAERDIDLGHVELGAGIGDARLSEHVGGAVAAGLGIHLVAAGE